MTVNLTKPKILVTLGPSTSNENDLWKLKEKGVDFVRVNMSHSNLDDLIYFIGLSKKVNIPFILDTEGSQVRTNEINGNEIHYCENDEIFIHKNMKLTDNHNISLRPPEILDKLDPGDILYVDFDSLSILITDVHNLSKGYIKGKVISAGSLGSSKGVYIDSFIKKKFSLPPLSKKDLDSINIGVKEKVRYIAASFIKSKKNIDTVKKVVQHKMQIISKIECVDALKNLDEIIEESDYLLIDRGDLSKEVPIEKIPQLQQIIIQKASLKNKGVFVATNLLESMIENRVPTKAEVHDVMRTCIDGAYGLILAAETAIGNNPFVCVNMLNKIINHSVNVPKNIIGKISFDKGIDANQVERYCNDHSLSSLLIQPHGGKLINRVSDAELRIISDKNLKVITVSDNTLIDFEQIAIGSYSPLDGFMNEENLNTVLDNYRLSNGKLWTLPIVLDVDSETARKIDIGEEVEVAGQDGIKVGKILINDIYSYDKNDLCKRLYGTSDKKYPGVKITRSLKPVFIGGEITLFKRPGKKTNPYNLSPMQTRRLFDGNNWHTIVGFHTRNVIHRAHEYIQMKALDSVHADGLFVHPAVGKKKKGDYSSKYIIKSYEYMMKNIYPSNKVVFATFNLYSRYGGLREAIFTAICRQNFGCSHFIMGRDHTGVDQFGNFNKKNIDINMLTSELDITIVNFDNVCYSTTKKSHYFSKSNEISNDQKLISGTKCREMLIGGETPPEWSMRRGISDLIIHGLQTKDNVFI